MYSLYQDVRWDGERVAGCEVRSSVEEESYLSLSFEGAGPGRDSLRRHYQDVQWLIGCSEGHSMQQLILLEGYYSYYKFGGLRMFRWQFYQVMEDEALTCWHGFFARFGEGLLEGATICNLEFSEHCILKKKTKAQGLRGYCVHIDIWGPIKTASLENHRYIIFFVEDWSRYCWIYPIRQKFDFLALFVKLKKLMENQTARKIKVLQFDHVGGYKNLFLQFDQYNGMKMHITIRNDGFAMKINFALLEKVQYLLFNASLDNYFGLSLWLMPAIL